MLILDDIQEIYTVYYLKTLSILFSSLKHPVKGITGILYERSEIVGYSGSYPQQIESISR